MFWRPDRLNLALPGVLAVLLLLLGSVSVAADDEILPADTEIWLVSYGPGDIYWQRFGHNAIWVRDAQLGLDHVFNFGFFDFGQKDFFLRFLQGRMLYFSAARPAREEFSDYINENRSIRAQHLDLSLEQKLRLVEYLLKEVRPENREYLYDYYENNCSTRVRDALDLSLDGLLREEFEPVMAEQSWRDHTRRLTAGDFWLYLGLEAGLGSEVDRPINRWEEMFIPATLADYVSAVEFTGAGQVHPLVLEDVMLYESSLPLPPSRPMSWWPRYLLFSLGLILLVRLFDRYLLHGTGRKLSMAWLLVSGCAGLSLLFLWFGTDHVAAGNNLNLLVFNPLWIPLVFLKGQAKALLAIVLLFSVLALLMVLLPPGQYALDVLAAFLPLNLISAVVISRYRSQQAGRPGVPE